MSYYLFEFMWQCNKLPSLLSCSELQVLQEEFTEIMGCFSTYDKKLRFINVFDGTTDFSRILMVNIDLKKQKTRFLFIRLHPPPGVHHHDYICKWQHNDLYVFVPITELASVGIDSVLFAVQRSEGCVDVRGEGRIASV